MPSIPPESCHHRVEKSLPETSFEVVIKCTDKDDADGVLYRAIDVFDAHEVERREVAK